MRVALVYRAFHLSGSLPRFHVELARYLSGRGHDVHVYSTAVNTERSLAPACTFHNVPVEAIARGSGMSRRELRSFARAAAALLERADYDIVHTRAPSTWVADVLHVPGVQRGEAELEGRGVVRLRLSRLRHPGNQARFAIERRALRNPRVVQFHTDAPIVRDHLVRFYGIDAEKIRVVPPGINPEEFRPGDRHLARELTGLPADGDPSCCSAGTISRAKDSTARSGRRRITTELRAHRRRPERRSGAFEGSQSDCGVRDRVHFFGADRTAFLFYQAADVFVLPTRADIWGVTVLEAMACGIPPDRQRCGGRRRRSRTESRLRLPARGTRADRGDLRSRLGDPGSAGRWHRCRATALRYTSRRTDAPSSRSSRRSCAGSALSRRLAVPPAGLRPGVSLVAVTGRTRSGRCGAAA